MKKIYGFIFAVATLAEGCSSDDTFRVSGVIEGADDMSVVVEKADYNGYWTPIDSTHTNNNGKFKLNVAAADRPEIYRLSVDGRYIYFPVDSTENISLNTTLKNFGVSYTLEGSEQARDFAIFDQEAIKLISKDDTAREQFKRDVFNKYIKDRKGKLISYYVLTKSLDGKLLYDPTRSEDLKYFNAVATIFKNFNPDDPRTAVLEQMALQGLKKRNREMGKKNVVNATVLDVIDISLPGIDGNNKTLMQTIQPGKPTVLIFTSLKDTNTPEITLKLRELYDSKSGRINFYHVNVDGDRYAWRDAAKNLPWTSVYADTQIDGKTLRDYNITEVPMYFIYNQNSELVNRAENIETLSSILSAY
ncbi:MAG: DUF4369 domain-containing protein [Prevotella sp.]|nr:DUF4369 domain-containing protein [Bacteroides sp.]MCM1366815.1 DUF4369 domain-containing protein [Prevotella sp.]MCM1437396.1 DUF4369 domain-containing protein [Prevotella sp.]